MKVRIVPAKEITPKKGLRAKDYVLRRFNVVVVEEVQYTAKVEFHAQDVAEFRQGVAELSKEAHDVLQRKIREAGRGQRKVLNWHLRHVEEDHLKEGPDDT